MTNPIRSVVMPLKADAIKRAEEFARKHIASVLAALADHNWDANAYAPFPRSTQLSREEYRRRKTKYDVCRMLTDSADPRGYHRPNEPELRKASPEREARYIENARELAAAQYDAFVAKLCAKVGECYDAQIEGSHVWGYSVLTVWKHNLPAERWQTQMIVNVSKLGTVFNQWPTRKLKR